MKTCILMSLIIYLVIFPNTNSSRFYNSAQELPQNKYINCSLKAYDFSTKRKVNSIGISETILIGLKGNLYFIFNMKILWRMFFISVVPTTEKLITWYFIFYVPKDPIILHGIPGSEQTIDVLITNTAGNNL